MRIRLIFSIGFFGNLFSDDFYDYIIFYDLVGEPLIVNCIDKKTGETIKVV